MISKDEMKKLLKGMSPDLFDNVILLCGGSIYDCYRMLKEDAGFMRKKAQSEDMLALLNINSDVQNNNGMAIPQPRRKITQASNILTILSTL